MMFPSPSSLSRCSSVFHSLTTFVVREDMDDSNDELMMIFVVDCKNDGQKEDDDMFDRVSNGETLRVTNHRHRHCPHQLHQIIIIIFMIFFVVVIRAANFAAIWSCASLRRYWRKSALYLRIKPAPFNQGRWWFYHYLDCGNYNYYTQ